VLGRALDGVEAVANYWLQQIAPGRALTVRAEGDAGKITIGLQGFGGGKYKAASAGERRRVDAPLLLALAEVAGHGNHRGTLFLDEVFDALDRDGRALVCQALAELGQTQSVVVITHAEDLARAIPAVQRFEVSAGELRAIR
jgi:DNA repair exonuclease SbcCD ATPase subunit